METFLYVVHIAVSFIIVIVILLQSGQGGGLGAGFSSAAAMGQEVFGGRGAASFLGKLTWVLGFTFMAVSMGLAWYSSQPASALDTDMRAEDPVQQVVHTVVDEGGSAALPDDAVDGGAVQPADAEGVEMEVVDPDDVEDDSRPALEYEEDEGADVDEDIRQGFQDAEQQINEPGDEPAEAEEPIEADDTIEADVDDEADETIEADVDDEAQPAEEAEDDAATEGE